MARMVKLEELQAELANIHSLAGNTCVLIECMLWGECALNRQKKLEEMGPGGDLTYFRYSHDEIEAACGGEIALMVREKVMARRDRILAESV